MFKLYFQSKKEARKQKEAGDMKGSLGKKERRRKANSEATWRVGSSTRRFDTKIREATRGVLVVYGFLKGDSASLLAIRRVAPVLRKL